AHSPHRAHPRTNPLLPLPASLRAPRLPLALLFFFLNDPAPPDISTLSLHDALPIFPPRARRGSPRAAGDLGPRLPRGHRRAGERSEEHTSELQSLTNLVCRLLLEKTKTNGSHASIVLARHRTTVCSAAVDSSAGVMA